MAAGAGTAGLKLQSCNECGNHNCSSNKLIQGGLKDNGTSDNGTSDNGTSDNGMVCSTWGPPRWFSLHMTTFGYPMIPTEAQKTHTRQLVHMWEHELPCCCCQSNYRKHISSLLERPGSDSFASRQAFIQFGFDLHNKVNEALKKPVLSPIELNKLRRLYESCRAGYEHTYAHATIVLRHPDDVNLDDKHVNATKAPIVSVDKRCVLPALSKT